MTVIARTASTFLVAVAVLLPAPARSAAQQADSTRIVELERRLDAVTRELERMGLGSDVVTADSAVHGFGPAASKVYHTNRGVSIGGYGEILYENHAGERQDGTPASAVDRFDALRVIVYVGYKFNDRLLFNSEIEIEHANEIGLEFGYLDYRVGDNVGIRAGLLLAPLGLVNELHEPPVYLGTERPITESVIIPTTWRENGIGLFGDAGDFAWRLYVMNSFDGTKFTADGLRGGRQKGAKATAEDVGFAGRVDYTGRPGLLVGASSFVGNTGQNREAAGETVDGRLIVWDLHADYKVNGFDLRALVAGARIEDPISLNALIGLTGSDAVAEDMLGWYVQGGYDVLRGTASEHQLVPYVRYERVNTQRGMVSPFTADPATDLTVVSLGAAWKPVPQVVWKLDYQLHSNGADTGTDQWNVQMGWLF